MAHIDLPRYLGEKGPVPNICALFTTFKGFRLP